MLITLTIYVEIFHVFSSSYLKKKCICFGENDMGIRHCRKIELGGVVNIFGIIDGRTPRTVTLYIYSFNSTTCITCWYHLKELSWSLYDTSFHLIKWHLKVTGKWQFLMFMRSICNYFINILQSYMYNDLLYIAYSGNKRHYTKF